MPYTISILIGSAREGRQGVKVANYVANRLKAQGKNPSSIIMEYVLNNA